MANSEYEYVKREFEFDCRLPPSNWIVVRIDGCHFHRFSKIHAFEKPNDESALRLMNACATSMLEKFPDIVFAYGVSDEYSFVFRQETEFYQRRESKILSLCVSYFTSMYVMKWKDFFPNKELREPPYFDGRAVCYPNLKTIRDYLAWRQVDCHINNQYNTCFWMLVMSGKTEKEAQQTLKDKNELLLRQFQINYDDEPAIFQKGSCVYRDKVEIKVKTDDYGNPIKRTRLVVTVANVDIIGPKFWEDHQYILREEKYRYEYVKKFNIIHRLPPCNWIVVRINACQVDQFSLTHSFDKPNDETDLRLMNASASLMMERFPDIIFGYGFRDEYSFVFQEKTELYQRQKSLMLSSCSSYFTSFYMMKWKEFSPSKELVQSPHFEAEVLCYPKPKIVCDYLSWRQAESTVDEIREVRALVTLPISEDRTRLATLAGWFDVHFWGSKQNPAVQEVELSTAPDETGGTHWGQQVFLLTPPLRVNEGDTVKVSFSMVRSKENHRLMDLEFTYELHESSGKQLPAITTKIYLE